MWVADDWHIIYIIYCLVEAGVGVEVFAELHSDALEVGLEAVAGEVCGSVETHVFQEVGQSALVVVFLHRAHLLCYVEVGTLFGPLVVAYVVGEAVWQPTHLYCGVEGQLGQLHLLGKCGREHC